MANYVPAKKRGAQPKPLPEFCEIPDCGRRPLGRITHDGRLWVLCSMHFQRVRRAPHRLSAAHRLIRRNGEGTISRGYRILHVNGKTIGEHRHVMAQILGRPLARNEHVHHKNGNRLDNRPDNLVIVSPDEHKLLHFRCDYRIHGHDVPALVALRDALNSLIAKLS